MKFFKIRPILIGLSTIGIAFLLLSWGVIGHERINRAAVMTLPKPLQTFFTIILILSHKNLLFQI